MAEYDWTLVEAHPASDIAPMSDELAALAAASPYPAELIDRALAARVDRGMIQAWCESGFPPPDHLDKWLTQQERLLSTTLVTRAATWADDALLTDLCANSPESVGEWTVTVERGPNPYAQYRLQEHPHVIVLEDRRVALGMSAGSVRNTIIDGERTSAYFMSGWRVRDGFRGLGLSGLLQSAAGPGASWFGLVMYWLVRSQNASAGWIDRITDEMEERPGDWRIETDQLSATVTVFTAPPQPSTPEHPFTIRPTEAADLDRCVELINASNDGLDLFRPYTRAYLEERMDDPSWGPKPSFYPEVYGWADHRVVEVDGQIVACGGCWDRGRDIREVWRRDDVERVVDPTALMDYGRADGPIGVDALSALIRTLVDDTARLGRTGLMAAIEFQPEVAAALNDLEQVSDTRELHVMPFTSPDLKVEATITRPYIDLAYW